MFGLIPWKERKSHAVSPRAGNPLQLMGDDFQSMFDRFFSEWPMVSWSGQDGWHLPRNWGLELEEKDKEVFLRAELPGFELNEVNVELKENVLTIEARHEFKEGDENAERCANHVKRSITLPPGLDFEKTDAKYRNGVLDIHVPRLPEAQGRRIEINKSDN